MLVGFCNPLLDISVEVKDESLLERFNLKPNDAILSGEEQEGLIEEIEGLQKTYSAGGAGQNTIRAAQSVLPKGRPRMASLVAAAISLALMTSPSSSSGSSMGSGAGLDF